MARANSTTPRSSAPGSRRQILRLPPRVRQRLVQRAARHHQHHPRLANQNLRRRAPPPLNLRSWGQRTTPGTTTAKNLWAIHSRDGRPQPTLSTVPTFKVAELIGPPPLRRPVVQIGPPDGSRLGANISSRTPAVALGAYKLTGVDVGTKPPPATPLRRHQLSKKTPLRTRFPPPSLHPRSDARRRSTLEQYSPLLKASPSIPPRLPISFYRVPQKTVLNKGTGGHVRAQGFITLPPPAKPAPPDAGSPRHFQPSVFVHLGSGFDDNRGPRPRRRGAAAAPSLLPRI